MSFCLILTVVSMNPEQLPMRSGWEGLGEAVWAFVSSLSSSSSSSSPSLVVADPPLEGGCKKAICVDTHCFLSQKLNLEHEGQPKGSNLNWKLCWHVCFLFSHNNSHVLAKGMRIIKIQKCLCSSPVLCHCCHRTAEQHSAGEFCAERQVVGVCQQEWRSGWLDPAQLHQSTPAWRKSDQMYIWCKSHRWIKALCSGSYWKTWEC